MSSTSRTSERRFSATPLIFRLSWFHGWFGARKLLRPIRILNAWSCPWFIVLAVCILGCPNPNRYITLEKPSGGTTKKLTIEPERDVEVEIRGLSGFSSRTRFYALRLSVEITVKKEFSTISNVRERMSVKFHSLPMNLDSLYEYSYDRLTARGFKMVAVFVIGNDTHKFPSVESESYEGPLQIFLDSVFVLDGEPIRIAPINGWEKKSGYYY